MIRQLREGQAVDIADYEVPVQEGSRDEIEQVQHAINVVQQTAVKSAIDEARLRRGISDVFRNLAGRSQSLLHRQLTLLDGMERRATEPDELEDLFRIDHLTTRMRRHAEGLIILSGEAPARGWRQPVPLIDVLRAAVAEVEDYTRIRVLARTRAAVAGHAVADVIHLIAELAENATVFSPPNTPVRIQGDIVGKGFAIEIEDRGLGISPDRLAEINRDLADPPQFDLSDSDRLGLFIAGQLARRHDIHIALQPSVYGGTTAIVLLPMALVVEEDSYVPDPALPAGSSTGHSRPARRAGWLRARPAHGRERPGPEPGVRCRGQPAVRHPSVRGHAGRRGLLLRAARVYRAGPLPGRRGNSVGQRSGDQLACGRASDRTGSGAPAPGRPAARQPAWSRPPHRRARLAARGPGRERGDEHRIAGPARRRRCPGQPADRGAAARRARRARSGGAQAGCAQPVRHPAAR